VNQSLAGLGVRSEQVEIAASEPTARRGPDDKLNVRSSLAFFGVHLVPLFAIFTGVTRTALILAVVTFTTRMFCITAGYHRYFSHKSYRLNRFWQFMLAFGGTMASQKGPLWWAAHHRNHHRFSDTERDVHSPKRGFWWSHVGWILCDKYNQADMSQIRDFAKYPEIRFINKHDWIGPWTLAVLCFLIGGWSGLVIGFFLSTVVLWHVTFTVNSVAHVMGRRAYETGDTSRNTLLVALATGGEGWHNNHHRYPWSARQGFRWWQIDMTFYALRALSWVGIVRDLRPVPVTVIEEARAAKARDRASDTSRPSR
jgi:stearoyl-CoA desaturase (delta-9 desaturase)